MRQGELRSGRHRIKSVPTAYLRPLQSIPPQVAVKQMDWDKSVMGAKDAQNVIP